MSVELLEDVACSHLYSDQLSAIKYISHNSDTSLLGYIEENADVVLKELTQRGAILFRGFKLSSTSDFKAASQALFKDLLPYLNQSTPRSHVGGNVYTATEYPAEEVIPLHNENAYCNNWPRYLSFYSAVAAETGGETPLADSRRVFNRIKPEIRQAFADKKVMYVRNFGMGVDLSWQVVFQTDSKVEVESYLVSQNIQFDWEGDLLRTKETCPAVIQHPVTKEWSWFNQAHLFHISSIDPDISEYMISEFGKDRLPRNAYFGDGSDIPDEYFVDIREAYRAEKQKFTWHQGDFLLVDNILYAHGREAFSGERRTLVAMGS